MHKLWDYPQDPCKLESFGTNGMKAQQLRNTKAFKGVLSGILKKKKRHKDTLLLVIVHICANFCLSHHLRQVISSVCRLTRAVTFGLQSLKKRFLWPFLLHFTNVSIRSASRHDAAPHRRPVSLAPGRSGLREGNVWFWGFFRLFIRFRPAAR